MPPYELIQPFTLRSWVVSSVIDHMLDGFYVSDDLEATFLYWTDKARTYDGFDWDNPNEELGFWLQVVYKLCDEHYDVGLWRDVKRIISNRLKENLHVLEHENEVKAD